MNLTDKLDYLMAQKGLNKRKFSAESGIPYMTIVNFYEKGTENVKLSTLKKISAFFNVSLDYIANDNIEKICPIASSSDFTSLEIQHIKKYRTLDGYGKEAVDTILDIEYKRCTTTPVLLQSKE